jgi:hypothetical protein
MALTDAILASIEAELVALKETTPAPIEVVSAPITPIAAPVATVAPVITINDNPILQMAIDQAAFRLARETAK